MYELNSFFINVQIEICFEKKKLNKTNIDLLLHMVI